MIDGDAPVGWNRKNGWRAAVWMALCVELIIAGTSRTCTRSFDPMIIPMYLLMFNTFGVAEVLWVLVGGVSFALAAYPTTIVTNVITRSIVVAAAAGAGLICQVALRFDDAITQPWLAFLQPVLALLGYAVAVGFLLNGSVRVRGYWIPLAIVTALAIGIIEFMTLPYGLPDCWP